MGVTQVQATIYGDKETRRYTFTVDTGSTYLALPLEEIDALGLEGGDWGKVMLVSATGPVEVDTYSARGEVMGERFRAIMVPAPTPLLGYELLQNLRFKVNPVTHEIEKVPEDEVHPPFQL